MSITVCDVCARDGLQNDPAHLEPAVRAELVNRLADAGVTALEVASFVNPKLVPRMAGAEEVVQAIERRPGVVYSGLVLNVRGYERLAACELDEVHFAVAASETLNRRNQNASVEESLADAERIIERAHADGRRATVIIAASFGCPYEGAIDPASVLAVAEQAAEAGADELVLADTIGVGVPHQVRTLVSGAREHGLPVGVHLHDTRGTGLANAYAAVEAGATSLDASVGGVGGCPFAPGATGNIATEDLVYLLHGEGWSMGIDLDALIAVAHWLEEQLGHPVPGRVQRAGDFKAVSAASALERRDR
ncbi:MAG TPA: hydroxymethylglutaryl-CoA lyase [Solirubrobacteraceae bacterium]|nr:hydroxymethylglutaryl-CoA lyase [Solirubrobacteraceae bacterium]